MTYVEYFEKQLKKHGCDFRTALARGASEEILENISFKIQACGAAIKALKESEEKQNVQTD